VTTDATSSATLGDSEAFGRLVDPYRRELHVHCYRILGSVADAEDALQEALLAAWQGLAGFEGRSSMRTWLYRVATSRCLDALRSRSRRPRQDTPSSGDRRTIDLASVDPYPDALLEGVADDLPGLKHDTKRKKPPRSRSSRRCMSCRHVSAQW
jgi:RNA polymerase sigma factor (sigma-70 family)